MATLKDIGKKLGLSPATVSRALNGFPEVNEKTRELVLATAKQMSYVPNPIAQKLVTGRSGMVGMVLKSQKDLAVDPSFFQIIFGLSAHLVAHDLDLVFHVSTDDDPVAPYRRLLSKDTLDAFILNAPEVDDPRIAFLRENKIPFIVHGRTEGADYPFYDIDNAKVGEISTKLLIELGHRRIAFINGPETYAFAQERTRGYNQAISSGNILVPPVFRPHGLATEQYGFEFAQAAMSGMLGKPPTAFVCASTAIAAGVMMAVEEAGKSVGTDVSVIAHDDAIPQVRAESFEPALSVTRAPMRNACEPLAVKMRAMLKGGDPFELQTTEPIELIIRKSTGPVVDGEAKPWS